MVKTPPPLGFINPEEDIARYCFQHAKEMQIASGFFPRVTDKSFVDFECARLLNDSSRQAQTELTR